MTMLSAAAAALRRRFLQAPRRWSGVIVIALLSGYAIFVSIRVVGEFEQRRWDVPASVYAAPLEIYAGLDMSASDVAATLDKLGYLRVPLVRRPGEYSAAAASIALWTRPFRFWDAAEPAEQLTISFDGRPGQRRVVSVRDMTSGAVPLLRLEPMRLGSIFAAHHEDRLLVEPADIPALLSGILKAVEDRKFDRHHGIDFAAIARAAWVNLRHGEIRQGGSTLTQQLVKSYFLDGRQTFSRKIREAIMAVALESRYSKDELLHAYVNEIYLGQQGARAIHGFGLASEFYFAKHLGQLELHELALLVALVKGPSYYDPLRHPERALARRNLVLQMIADLGVVDEARAAVARSRELGVVANTRVGSRYQPAYMDLVRRQLATDYPLDELASRGLRVFTSLDPRIQARAEQELVAGLQRIQETSAPGATVDGATEGAVIVTHPATGEVLAIVGGRRVDFDGFNRALNARRQVGSLIKPFVFLAALQSGEYTLVSTLSDRPIDVPLENGDVWSPQNFGNESHGDVPLIRALASSYNQATVQLGLAVGLPAVVNLLQRLGVERDIVPYPSLLLGAIDFSPLEVAQLYNALANGGFQVPLRAVRSVLDAEGQPLNRYSLQLQPAASPASVQQLNHALAAAIDFGTGRPARRILPADIVFAGKTGTTDDFRDSWFAGFSSDYLAVVWLGRDDNQPIGLSGASGALTIWAPLMAGLDHSQGNFLGSSPPLKPVWIDFATGLASRSGCSESLQVPLPANTSLQRLPGCGSGLASRALDWLSKARERR